MIEPLLPTQSSLGRVLWGAHALWVTVLEGWMSFHRKSGEEVASWGEVEFDKLAHSLHLIWRALYLKRQVSFDSIYHSVEGIHGHGPALASRGRPAKKIHALKVINHIQDTFKRHTPDIHLLAITPGRGHAMGRVRPGHVRAYSPMHLSKDTRAGWDERDQSAVNQLREAFEDMTQQEIRALGTHQTETNTLEAIEYNVFSQLFYRVMMKLEYIENRGVKKQGGQPAEELGERSIDSVIDEVGRKAGGNHAAYSSARRHLSKQASDGNAAAGLALSEVFRDANSIWTQKVTSWVGEQEYLQALSLYLRGLGNVCMPKAAPERKDERARHEQRLIEEHERAERSVLKLSDRFKTTLPKIPSSSKETYDWHSLKVSIVRIFDALPGETKWRDKYDEIVSQRFSDL